MSFELMTWAMRQRTGSGTRKAVLVTLADHASAETGECFPSITRVSKQTELGETAVKSALKALVELGLIARERRRNKDGSLGSYSYTFPGAALAWVERRETPAHSSETPLGPQASAAYEPGKDLEPREVRPSDSPPGDGVSRIYDHWREARGKTRASYDSISPARRKKIEARLKEFSEEELHAAIDGVGADPWPDRRLHDDITVIFRSREQVDRFLEMAATGSPLSEFHRHAQTAVDNARRRHAG